jgi:pimeloyl-ACP methyl ester carboxylesterase
MADGRMQGEVRGADGTRIAFHSHGGSRAGPVLVLTNGIGTTENFWRFLVADLQRDHRVVHWDYRGHGRSQVSASGDYRIRTQADDLARVTEAVREAGQPPPVHIGFSMGVAVVLELYRARADLVRALALIAGAPDAPGTGTPLFSMLGGMRTARALAAMVAPALPLLAPGLRAVLRSNALDPLARAAGVLQPGADKQDIRQFLDGIAAMDPAAYWGTLQGLLEASASDVLPTVQVPVAIVAAAHDTLMPRAQVERMRAALPQARYVEIADAGHAGLIEQGPRMVEAVRALLAGVEREEGAAG